MNNPDSIIRYVKHQLSSAKLDMKAQKHDRATETIGNAIKILQEWRSKIKQEEHDTSKKEDKETLDDGNKQATNEKETYVSVVENFHFEQTFKPEKCNVVASSDGDYLKVQYVAWTLPDKTMFASSFHTGSLPLKVVLGAKDQISGVSMSEGLRGACRGERRNVFVPASQVPASFNKIRVKADLKFAIEVVEIGKQSSNRRNRKGDL